MWPIIGAVVTFVVLLSVIILMIVFRNRLAVKNGGLSKVLLLMFFIVAFIAWLVLVIKNFYDAFDAEHWHFYNSLPTANMSPFLFCFGFLVYAFKEKLSNKVKAFYVLISVAMGAVATITPVVCYVANCINKYTVSMFLDSISHSAYCLIGVLLLISGEVKLTNKTLFDSFIVAGVIVAVQLFCNFVFKTNFFGLGYFANWNIYSFLTFKSYWLTLFVYIAGLYAILALTFLIYKLPFWIKKQAQKMHVLKVR